MRDATHACNATKNKSDRMCKPVVSAMHGEIVELGVRETQDCWMHVSTPSRVAFHPQSRSTKHALCAGKNLIC